MERPDRLDPYRVLGVPPGAPIDEVKAAYRRLAKRHHPDAGGPAGLARFLAIQAAYETIARSRGGMARATGAAARTPGPSARGAQRDTGRDWYTAAREAARARSRAGRGHGTGPRARGGGAAGTGQAPTPGSGASSGGPGGRPGRTGRGPDDARRPASWRRTARLGSTTYDDVPDEPPPWHGAGWYGAASGTYWTVNPREYADPRKHGPAYLGRTTEWTGDRPDVDHGPWGGAAPWRSAPGRMPPARDPGDRRPADAARATTDSAPSPRPAGRAAAIVAAVRAALDIRGRPDRPVG